MKGFGVSWKRPVSGHGVGVVTGSGKQAELAWRQIGAALTSRGRQCLRSVATFSRRDELLGLDQAQTIALGERCGSTVNPSPNAETIQITRNRAMDVTRQSDQGD